MHRALYSMSRPSDSDLHWSLSYVVILRSLSVASALSMPPYCGWPRHLLGLSRAWRSSEQYFIYVRGWILFQIADYHLITKRYGWQDSHWRCLQHVLPYFVSVSRIVRTWLVSLLDCKWASLITPSTASRPPLRRFNGRSLSLSARAIQLSLTLCLRYVMFWSMCICRFSKLLRTSTFAIQRASST